MGIGDGYGMGGMTMGQARWVRWSGVGCRVMG